MILKALRLAGIAAIFTGCAVEASDAQTAFNDADPALGLLSPEEGRALAHAVEAAALEEAAAQEGEKDPGDDVRKKDQAILGSDACKDIDLRIKSYRSGLTKVVGVQFWSSTDGKWRYEDLDNKQFEYGEDGTWTPNLSYTKNDYITHWKIKYQTHQGSNNWGVKTWSASQYSDVMRAAEGDSIKCKRSTNFTLTLDRYNE